MEWSMYPVVDIKCLRFIHVIAHASTSLILWLHNIPTYGCITKCVSIHLWMHFWVVSTLWLLWLVLPGPAPFNSTNNQKQAAAPHAATARASLLHLASPIQSQSDTCRLIWSHGKYTASPSWTSHPKSPKAFNPTPLRWAQLGNSRLWDSLEDDWDRF